MSVPIEVFLVAVLLVYFLGRRHGKMALKKKYQEFFQ